MTTWPQGPLGQRYTIWDGTQWVDVTGDVRTVENTVTTRGRPDEASQPTPGRCAFHINNRDGRYTPRNHRSDLYGLIGRNTPMRHEVRGPAPYLLVPDLAGARARVASTSALNISGDLDVRVDAALDRVAAQDPVLTPFAPFAQEVIARYNVTGNARMWRLLISSLGSPVLTWSTTGADLKELAATEVLPVAAGERFGLRVTFDVDNGAGGHTARFFIARDLDGPWQELGLPVTGSGTTSINTTGTADLEIGDIASIGFSRGPGRYYRAQIRSGIDGTVLASPVFSSQITGTTSFSDSAGRTWLISGGSEITDYYQRFSGEIPSWPPRWDVSGTDVWTGLEATGPRRRLSQGQKALKSTLSRRVPSYSPVAYWPMEEAREATQGYSPIEGVTPLAATGLSWAADDTLPGSSALPTINAGATMRGAVPAPTGAPTSWHTEFVARLDSAPATYRTVIRYQSTGTIADWWIQLQTGIARVQGYDADGSLVVDQAVGIGSDVYDGRWNRWLFYASQSGGTVSWTIRWLYVGSGGGSFSSSYTGTLGRITGVSSPPAWHSDLAGIAIGHIAVFAPQQLDAFEAADDGFAGEAATIRMRRLAQEERLPLNVTGAAANAAAMGPQRPAPLLALLDECAAADGGLLTERRTGIAQEYQIRRLRYNRRPALQLDYAAGHIAPPLEPVDDDLDVRNDVTRTRRGGSSARAVLETGTLSVQDPPAGIGLYDEAVELNVARDDQLEGLAWWRLHLTTVNETRYPKVTLNLRNPASQAWLQEYLDRVDIGARITIANPPQWLPADPIDLIVQAYTETVNEYDWTVELTCTPASPWTVATTAPDAPTATSPPHRADTLLSTLAAPATAAATTLSVATDTAAGGYTWTTNAAHFPFGIVAGGEPMTVTGITGTSSPQTFNVTRTPAWAADHNPGEPVHLAPPAPAIGL